MGIQKKIRLCTILILNASIEANSSLYVVRRGDVLSEVLFRNVPGRIYGKNGNLSKVKKINPELHSVSHIVPGETIVLPAGEGQFTQYELMLRSKSKKVVKKSTLEDFRKVTDKSIFQHLYIEAHLSSISLNAIDLISGENEISTSDLSFGLGLEWQHYWNKHFGLLFQFSYSQYDFKVSANKSLVDEKINKLYGGVGLKYSSSKHHSYVFQTGLEEKLLLTSQTSNTLRIDKNTAPTFTISGKHLFKSFSEKFHLVGFWKGGVNFGTTQPDYSTDSGFFWSLGFGSSFRDNNKFFNIDINYAQSSFGTSRLEQTTKEASISIGAGFEF